MDTSNHFTMQSLFDQLGLSSEPEQIRRFIKEHKLKREQRITNAKFWSPAQASFLQEAIEEDAEWAELVDHLDAQLHQ